MRYNVDDVSTWPAFKPLIIAHDVGRSRDRSTAVVGGNSPYGQARAWNSPTAEELPQNLFGSCARQRACGGRSAPRLRTALIVADLSIDATYGEMLFENFRSAGDRPSDQPLMETA